MPPFRLDLTVWALRRRADNAIDRWDGTTYRRAVVLPHALAEVAVTQTAPREIARIEVTISAVRVSDALRTQVKQLLDRMLGLNVDLAPFYARAAHDTMLGPLAERFRGVKPPRFPTLFEAVANAIACQQITLTLGIHLLNRLVEGFGPILETAQDVVHAFPRPQDLARLTSDTLRPLGFSGQKARALIELASAAANGAVDLEHLDTLDSTTAVERLLRLRGVGRWSAEYVLLRGLGRTEVFPGDDVGARNHLALWLGLHGALDYEDVRRILEPWQPYSGLVYFHLLLKRLAEEGCPI